MRLGFRALVVLLPVALQAQEVHHRTWRIEFPTSASGQAQEEFLDGLTAYHLCMFEDALEHFRAAEKLAPNFAMAYWGEALAHHRPIWSIYERDAARAVLNRLAPTAEARLAKGGTPREKAYLSAVEVLYADGTTSEREQAYLDAMRRVSEQYPDDTEALALYSLMKVVGYDRSDERDRMDTARMSLEVLRRNPLHPGAPRYLIQTVDDALHAPLGLVAVRALQAWPEEGGSESVHISSHIYLLYGMWDEMEQTNARAFDVSMDWTKRHGAKLSDLNLHNYQHLLDFRQYSLLQLGRYRDAQDIVDRTSSDYVASGRAPQIGGAYFGSRARYILETNQWDQVPALADEARTAGFWRNPTVLQAVGIGAAKSGKLDLARNAAQTLAGLPEPQARTASLAQLRAGLGTRVQPATLEIEGLIALAQGDEDTALSKLQASVEHADKNPMGLLPNPSKPPQELYGEVLLKLNRPAEALRQFDQELELYRGRSAALLGAARANMQLGRQVAAQKRYSELLKNWHNANPNPPGSDEALKALQNKSR